MTISAQLFIDGRQAAYDSLTNTYLATIPEAFFGTDMNALVEVSDQAEIAINNHLTKNKIYTFKDINGSSSYSLMFIDHKGNASRSKLMFTFLPIIRLQGTFGYDYTEGTVLLDDPSFDITDTLAARIKWRGGTTNVDGKHKRNYKIKLYEDHRLLGLRNDNNWLLDAGQADVFRLRNHIATELWNDMGTQPYYAHQEPKASLGVHGRVVEVFLNDEYRGIYSFTENMDRKQMRLKKTDSQTGEIHGVLWKAKAYTHGVMMMGTESPYDNQSETWDGFEVKYPDLNDVETTDWSTLWNAIDFASHTNDDYFAAHVEEYFDTNVTIDYFLFCNMLSAVDNAGKNMFWAVYDQQTDKRLTLAVWDLDATVGQPWLKKYDEEFISPYYRLETGYYLFERMLLMNCNNIQQRVINRYNELRKDLFTIDSLTQRYRYYTQMLQKAGADKRETSRWSGDSDIQNMTIDFEDQLQYICNWIEKRIQFLDPQFETLHFFNAIKPTNIRHSQSSIYDLQGRRMDAENRQLRPGIYIKDGRKYMIR